MCDHKASKPRFENALQNPKNFAYLQMFAIFKHHKISKPLIAAPGHPQTLMFSISTYCNYSICDDKSQEYK